MRSLTQQQQQMRPRRIEKPTNPFLAKEATHLQEKRNAALQWLNQYIQYFIPFKDGRLTNDGVKAFAEFTVVYGFLQQQQLSQYFNNQFFNDTLPTWRSFIIRHCEHNVYAETVRKRPAQAFYLLVPYLVLRATGFKNKYYEESIQLLRSWGFPKAMEVIPYRFLDQQYLLWKAGCLNRKPNWQKLYQQTVLGKKCSSVYIDDDSAYSITHTLFYLTDFGNHIPPLENTEIARIVDLVECLLLHYWRLANWDLVSELLTNLNCLGIINSVIYLGAAEALNNVWRRDGAIPANVNCENELKSIQSSEPSEVIFRHCYHTTLVSIFYCTPL